MTRITQADVQQAQQEADQQTAEATTPRARMEALEAHAFATRLRQRFCRQNTVDAALILGGTIVPGRPVR